MKRRVYIACAAMLAILLVSCASVPYDQTEKGVLRTVGLINEGKASGVKGISPVPFILDSETLYLESDVDTLWGNFKASSFSIPNPRFVLAAHIGPESYKTFADSFDMKAFFSKHTSSDTSVVSVDSDKGRFYLLLERETDGYPRIRGLKGPVQ